MRLSEPIEEQGFFWLPRAPKDRLAGTLRISESGGIELEVISPYDKPSNKNWYGISGPREIGRIIGIIRGKFVTLDECCRISAKSSRIRPNSKTGLCGITTAAFEAQFGFIGSYNYRDLDKIRFAAVDFGVEKIDEWLHMPVEDSKIYREQEKVHIDTTIPKSIELCLHNHKMKMGFVFGFNESLGPFHHEVRRETYISLEAEEPRPLEEFVSLIRRIRNFLRFAMNRPVSLKFVTGHLIEAKGDTGRTHDTLVSVYYEDTLPPKMPDALFMTGALFMYQDMREHCEKWLNEWLEVYEIAKKAFDPYFSYQLTIASQIIDEYTAEENFIRLAKAVEVLYNKGVLNLPPAKSRSGFEGKIKTILESFQGLYDVSLRDEKGNEKDFAEWVAVTRNHLTHYGREREEGSAARDKDLRRLTSRLSVLFKLCLLKRMGADEELMRSKATND